MDKKIIMKYILYIFLGAALGFLMQKMPQLQGQWGQNIFTYMATDIGCWAVICILIATHAESPWHSGFQCFACMASMVAVYYMIVPFTFMANLRWAAAAVLILPVGIVIRSYPKRAGIMILLELFLAGSLVLDVLTLRQMMSPGYQMIVHSAEGAVLTSPTAFSVANYILLTAFTVFGMLYLLLRYRDCEKNKCEMLLSEA